MGWEWVEADGLGGFASGPVEGARTRRYHALLLTAVDPPARRMVLVNGVEAWLEGAAGVVPLSTQFYAPGVVQPDGQSRVVGFAPLPWPAWRFAIPGGEVRFEIFVAADCAETVLRWTSDVAGRLCVRPLLSGRDMHALHHENPAFRFDAAPNGGNVSWRPYEGVPAVSALTNGDYAHAPQWYRNFLYLEERARGLDDTEDLASPGVFSFDLSAPAVMILRAGDGLAVRAAAHGAALASRERTRRSALPGLEGVIADSYLVDRGAGRTVMAGYPWFGDWGRDSFIALRGLAIATGRLADARAILLEWAGLVDCGMMPNRFPDDGGAAEYNSVDASLWFVIAVHDYLAAAPADAAAEAVLSAAVVAIIKGYRDGTRYRIGMESDGLIAAGEAGVQLTWMDAKCGDWVVTPRIGKPVEIQALWINALLIASRFLPEAAALAERAMASFRARFIRPEGGLYDVIDAGHIAGALDGSIRPNQIFAVGGLPFALLDGPAARAVVDEVESRLLTPMGLRTLDPAGPAYCPRYAGGPAQRDGAYHQGTVWPWLIGPFVQAWLRVHGDTDATRADAAARFLAPLEAHRAQAGIGHVSEVADGDFPHHPGGCPFQAWSAGELIRARRMVQAPTGV